MRRWEGEKVGRWEGEKGRRWDGERVGRWEGEKGWMGYGDWNNVKSLRFAWNAAGRSLSANMEFLTQKQKVLDIRTLRFWRSQDAFIRTRNGLFRNAGKAFRADGRGFTGT